MPEPDEYHATVSPVDTWVEYARLKSLGWTQQKIAKAKNVDKATVSRRLRFNDMPAKVKEVVQHNLLSEWHLQELLELSIAQHLSLADDRAGMEGISGEGST